MNRQPTCVLLVLSLLIQGCASTLREDAALVSAPYQVADNGLILVATHIDGHGPYRFALDTGASISVVLDGVRAELGLASVPGETVVIHGLVASGTYPLLQATRLEVGTERWPEPRLAVVPGRPAARENFDGILGIDYLKRYAVGFSVAERVVRLYAPETVSHRFYRGWASVPIEPAPIGDSGASLYFLSATIDGRDMRALFDLGAGRNIMNWQAASALNSSVRKAQGEERLSGILESAPVLAWFRADEVTTGRVRWTNERFVIADLDIFIKIMRGDSPLLMLGAGLFGQRDFIIDFARERLLVKVAMDELADPLP